MKRCLEKLAFLLLIGAWIMPAQNLCAQIPPLQWAKYQSYSHGNEIGRSVARDGAGNVYVTGEFSGHVDFDFGVGFNVLTSACAYDVFVAKYDASGNCVWAQRLGGLGAEIGWDIAVDAFGNVYVTGFFSGTCDFDPGPGVATRTSAGSNDIFVVKLDGSGNLVWARSMGGGGNDGAYSLVVDAGGNVFVSGFFSNTADFDPGAGTANLVSIQFGDVFVVKLDASGNYSWAASAGGPGEQRSYGITVDAAGNVWATGYFSNTVDFDPGAGTVNLSSLGNDAFIWKLTPAGLLSWVGAVGAAGGSSDYGHGIATDGSGNVYVTGIFVNTADFDPGPGTANITSAGAQDIFILKLDGSGNMVWSRGMGGPTGDYSNAITVTGGGDVVITGSFSGTADFDPGGGIANLTSSGLGDIFVAALDTAGLYRWASGFSGPTGTDIGYGVAADAAGNIATVGEFYGTVDFDPGAGTYNLNAIGYNDVFVSGLDAGGSFVFAGSMGTGVGGSDVRAIATDAGGNVYATGNYQGIVDFDPGPGMTIMTSNPSSTDAFVLKLDVNGNLIWVRSLGGTSADVGYGIAVDASGNVFTCGSFNGTADFDPGAGTFNLVSAGGDDVFVSALDNAGNFLWARRVGEFWGSDIGYGICTGPGGSVYITGHFNGFVDFDPGPGSVTLNATGASDIFVLNLDAAGNYVWAVKWGGTAADRRLGIDVDAAGNVHTTGWFTGTVDFDPGAGTANVGATGMTDAFVSKLDVAGNYLWARKIGGTIGDIGYGITGDGSGNVITTGYFANTADMDPGPGVANLTSSGLSDVFVSKLDASGNYVWGVRAGGTGDDGGYDIIHNAGDSLFLTGFFNGTGDFDPGAGNAPLTSYGNSDAFVMNLDPNGNYLWAGNMGGIFNDRGYAIGLGSVYLGGSFNALCDLDPGSGIYDSFGGGGGVAGYIVKLDDGPPLAFEEVVLEGEIGGPDPFGLEQNVVLSWSVHEVVPSARYHVERWMEGDFTVIAEVSVNVFTYTDVGLNSGSYRYRIRALYPDGRSFHSNVAEVTVAAHEKGWVMFPNPIHSGKELFLEGKGGSLIEIYNLQGQLVHSTKVPEAGGVMIVLPRGLYIIYLQGVSKGIRLVVE